MREKTVEILLATGNQGKLKEFEELLKGLPVSLITLKKHFPSVLEDGDSFLANAKKKALKLAEFSQMITLADDSGLEVDYLSGAPGVFSARFAGDNASDQENNQKLLRLLEGVSLEQRTARFKCVLVIACPSGKYYWTEGRCEGLIGFEPRGRQGFGYDPIFYLPEYGQNMAEISTEQKNYLSHRAKAVEKMKKIIKNYILADKEVKCSK